MTRDATEYLLDDEVLETPRQLTEEEFFCAGGPDWRRLGGPQPDPEDDR